MIIWIISIRPLNLILILIIIKIKNRINYANWEGINRPNKTLIKGQKQGKDKRMPRSYSSLLCKWRL